ncbi:serine protease inhibitor dipetalogastin-like [Neocloeon triangulifer]|uniref:serine protease inhibitor dipetalogastin-like n=1 Tax=Neocloeon triangulifer TaxID=2078957 RepID=UPI00286EDCD9|nr:serine protease inhibitor dipetalogastin-like [Neocloeon triangulifer]
MLLARSSLFLAFLAGAFATSRSYNIVGPAKSCQRAVKPDAWPIKKELQVCGTDGVIYPSLDALECSKMLKIVPARAVELQQERNKCDEKKQKEFKLSFLSFAARHEVCGSDNATYNNVWHLQETARTYKVEIQVQHVGVCKIDCPFSPIYKPVCASFTANFVQTFSNEEALKCFHIRSPHLKLVRKHDGACVFNFEYSFAPTNKICATNGFTYNGVSEIRALQKFNPKLRVMHDGACTIEEVKGLFSVHQIRELAENRFEKSTICGSDNSTYHSVFAFLVAQADRKAKGQDLRPVKCSKCDETTKSNGTIPICGTDGVTYHDEKTLKFTKTHHLILKDHDGPCSPSDKTGPCLKQLHSFAEVCATNGITYTSKEAVWCAALTNPKIKLFHQGECLNAANRQRGI